MTVKSIFKRETKLHLFSGSVSPTRLLCLSLLVAACHMLWRVIHIVSCGPVQSKQSKSFFIVLLGLSSSPSIRLTFNLHSTTHSALISGAGVGLQKGRVCPQGYTPSLQTVKTATSFSFHMSCVETLSLNLHNIICGAERQYRTSKWQIIICVLWTMMGDIITLN